MNQHNISIAIGRDGQFQTINNWLTYEVSNQLLEFGDSFAFTLPVDLFPLCQPDNEVRMFIDDSKVLTGFIDDRTVRGARVEVNGRDRAGRMLDASAPLLTFAGKNILDLARELVGDLFAEVRLDNAENRRLIGGRGRRRNVVGDEPILTGRDIEHKVEPGETIAEVLEHFLEQAQLFAWSSADGKALIIGKPNQGQATRWHFLYAGEGSARSQEANVTDRTYRESVADRYSQVTVCGSERGNRRRYGKEILQRRGTAKDGPGLDGIGAGFQFAKKLISPDSEIKSAADAQDEADRMLRELNATAVELDAVVTGHGQAHRPGALKEIYAFDTVARYEDEEIGVAGDYFVTGVAFSGSNDTDSTTITMVPKGTALRGLA